ncbi:hypothetical protein KIF59_23025 [Enterobacter cloacae subsp. cloacae]|nr:hypothetical protein [Enterobacter cloacae subsp. cloacae]
MSTAPSINSVVDNASRTSGPMQKGESTNDTTPTLSGSAVPGDIVSILDNGKVIGTVKADSNGKWARSPGYCAGGWQAPSPSRRLTQRASGTSGNFDRGSTLRHRLRQEKYRYQ